LVRGRIGIAPGVHAALGGAATGALPLGLSRQPLSIPGAKRPRVIPAYIHYRMLLLPLRELSLEPVVGRIVAGRLHKSRIALVGDLGLVHVEGIDVNLSDRGVVFQRIRIPSQARVRPIVGAAPGEFSAGNQDDSALGVEADVSAQEAEYAK